MHSGETCETLLPPHTKIPFRGIFFVWRRGILILTGSVQVVGTFFAHSKVPGNLFKSSRKVPRTLLPGQTKIPFRGIFFVPRRGLEPPQIALPVPKTGASTNFATWALDCAREYSREPQAMLELYQNQPTNTTKRYHI